MSKAVIGYWRRSVADSERIGTYDGSNATPVKPTEITAGRLPPHYFENLSEEATKTTRRNLATKGKTVRVDEESARSVSVLVAPLLATRCRESVRRVDYVVPVWLPATLMEDGTLYRREKAQPWIPRDHLDGGGDTEQERTIIGSIEALEKRKLENSEPVGEGWSDYLKYGESLLPEGWQDNLISQGYSLSSEMSLIKQDKGTGASKHLLNLYDHILEGKASIPALLEKFSSSTTSTPHPPLGCAELFKESSRLHLGHVSPYHLSRSQRESVLAALTLEQGEVLAVNGPPGTGKTTLLHAFWASQWVAAAERGESSPLTVVASANNQAIANVLESLGRDVAAKRWLPSIRAFGLFIASQEQQTKLTADTEWISGGKGFSGSGDVFGKYFTKDFIDQASEALMHKARRFFALYNRSIPQNVGEAANSLRQVLVATCRHYREVIAGVEKHNDLVAQIERMCPDGEARAVSDLQHVVKDTGHHAALWDRFRVCWDVHLASLPLWRELLSFLPPVRTVRDAADRAALEMSPDRRGLEETLRNGGRGAVGEEARKLHDEHKNRQREADARLRRIQETIAAIALSRKELRLKLRRWNPETQDVFSDNGALAVGDVARRRLLRLAVHYWEARWLSEASPMTEKSPWRANKGKAEKAWASLSMLFPCIVTTIYMGPGTFDYYAASTNGVPHYGIIDTLILDEAGQITPDTVGPMMALAKRALVVGDTEQLRPIPGVYKAIDFDNSVAFGVCADANDYTRHLDSGASSFSGSAMLLAQRATARSVGTGAPGMFLAEHRRCVDPIIAICNELSYEGAIIPERGTGAKAGIRPEYPFPHIGYAHIQGVEIQTPSGSRMNEIEADTIAQWISDNQETILSYYGKTDIDDCVAVATPFKAQGQKIAAALRLHDIYLSKCSTIHSLQGAEKPIVIFSSVHTKAGKSGCMFDRDREMLNVAISRAKDSFLVFGDMGKFDPSGSSRSSVLARHLFASPDNEIPVMVVRKKLEASGSVNLNILRSVEEHREFLNGCFTLAKERLVIISPWIGKHGVEKDHVMESIRGCVGRGVRVDIYADRANMQKATYQAKAAARSLVEAGASVIEIANIHQKSIYVDLCQMSEGSFNWLSASREDDKSGGPRRMLRDVTTVLSGAGVERELAESLAFLDSQN
jgi:hypothetical protein